MEDRRLRTLNVGFAEAHRNERHDVPILHCTEDLSVGAGGVPWDSGRATDPPHPRYHHTSTVRMLPMGDSQPRAVIHQATSGVEVCTW